MSETRVTAFWESTKHITYWLRHRHLVLYRNIFIESNILKFDKIYICLLLHEKKKRYKVWHCHRCYQSNEKFNMRGDSYIVHQEQSKLTRKTIEIYCLHAKKKIKAKRSKKIKNSEINCGLHQIRCWFGHLFSALSGRWRKSMYILKNWFHHIIYAYLDYI